MKKWGIALAAFSVFFLGLYLILDNWLIQRGVARSEADIRGVIDSGYDVYDPILESSAFWGFPFPSVVNWRLVRRGSFINLDGQVSSERALKFLESVNTPELSSETYPVESGRFQLTVDEAFIEGEIDLLAKRFRIWIRPLNPVD